MTAGEGAGGATHIVRPGRGSPNLKRRREAGPGDLHEAKENVEPLQAIGGAEEMKPEELDGLGFCAVAMLQLLESGKESERKRLLAALVQEREARAAKEAASAAELRRLEQENAELRESLASERKAAHSREQIVHLTSDLRRLEEEKAELQEKLSCERKNALSQRSELTGMEQQIVNLKSDLERTRKELAENEEDCMEYVHEVDNLKSKLECKEDEFFDIEHWRTVEYEDLEAELEKEKENSKCRICFARARNTVILPCSHFQYCNRCLQQHRKRAKTCPTCRVPITGTMDLYVS